MTWELYEVWAEDENGHEELVEATKSLKEANILAQKTLEEGAEVVRIFKENEDGDLDEIDVLYAD